MCIMQSGWDISLALSPTIAINISGKTMLESVVLSTAHCQIEPKLPSPDLNLKTIFKISTTWISKALLRSTFCDCSTGVEWHYGHSKKIIKGNALGPTTSVGTLSLFKPAYKGPKLSKKLHLPGGPRGSQSAPVVVCQMQIWFYHDEHSIKIIGSSEVFLMLRLLKGRSELDSSIISSITLRTTGKFF